MFSSWGLDKSKPIKPNITEVNIRYILVSVHSAMSDVSVDKQEFALEMHSNWDRTHCKFPCIPKLF